MADIQVFLDKIIVSDPVFHALVMESVRLIDHLVSLFDNSLSLSFNGGKDCCIVFHLTRYVLWRKYDGDDFSRALTSLKIVVFRDSDEFDEMRAFIEEFRQLYSLSYLVYDCDFLTGLQDLVTTQNVKIILLGVRRGDPMTENAESIQISSNSWPKFLRANPVLNWTYFQIWFFLIECGLKYCCLYDLGYTSIGRKSETVPNEALLIIDEVQHECLFKPAYKLENDKLERSNRIKRK